MNNTEALAAFQAADTTYQIELLRYLDSVDSLDDARQRLARAANDRQDALELLADGPA